jgi:hypothetical protein
MRSLLLQSLFTLFVVVTVQVWATAQLPSDKVYRDTQYRFTVFYSDKWMSVTPTHLETRLKLVDPEVEGLVDISFIAVPNKALQSWSSERFAREFTKDRVGATRMVQTGNPTATLVDLGATYLSNRDAIYLKATAKQRTMDGQFDITVYQIILLYQGVEYTLTFRSPTKWFNSRFEDFKAVASTFVVNPTRLDSVR